MLLDSELLHNYWRRANKTIQKLTGDVARGVFIEILWWWSSSTTHIVVPKEMFVNSISWDPSCRKRVAWTRLWRSTKSTIGIHSQWKNRALSYGGRIQQENWLLCGKLNYWFQSLYLPYGIIKKLRSIIYQLVWNEMKGIAWWYMARQKEEGGLGLRYPKILNLATTLKGVMRTWHSKSSIWAEWMHLC